MGTGQKFSDDEVNEFVIPSKKEVIFEIKSLRNKFVPYAFGEDHARCEDHARLEPRLEVPASIVSFRRDLGILFLLVFRFLVFSNV